MLNLPQNGELETRYEWLRPGQLNERKTQCPLILFPLAPWNITARTCPSARTR